MKWISALFLGVLLFLGGLNTKAQNPQYDSTLAKRLGGDEYGMKKYYLVILKTGENQTREKTFRDSCFKSHFANMKRMEEAGKLVVAGPITANPKSYRGIFILNANNQEEVQNLLKGDATVQTRILDTEIFEWYGSSALPLYLEFNDKVWRKKF